MNLPAFSVRRPVTVLMIIFIVMLFGLISFSRLGLDLLPNLEYPIVSVVTTYEGVSPEDMETLITKPIEEMVSTINHVKKVSSTSQEGISAIMIELEWGTNLDFAAQDVREKIAILQDFLPEDADKPLVLKLNVSDWPILYFGVTGMKDTKKLRKFLDENIKTRLERIDGVASAAILGGKEREINIFVDRDKLNAYHLSLDRIIQVLKAENLNVSGGHLEKGGKEYLIRTLGEFKDVKTIRNCIVTVSNGIPVYLKDVARVLDTIKEMRNYARTNKKESVLLAIMKRSGANTVKVINRVHKVLKEIKKELPAEIHFYPLMDQGREIKKVVKRTTSNAWMGGVLAVLFILLFLRNLRPSLVIAFAIPLSIITTFIGLYAVGYTLNIMTLAGLALGIGMLVDNSIVVIESIFRHIEQGEDRKKAAIDGTTEVGMAITASTLTTIAAFIPMTLATGIAGKLARPLALTVCLSLFASLFVAITQVPMMASRIINIDSDKKIRKKWFTPFEERYKRLLLKSLKKRGRIIFLCLTLFVLACMTVPYLGMEFMPASDTPMLMMMIRMPVGTSLKKTDMITKRIETLFLSQPEMEFVSAFVGLSKLSKMDVAWGSGTTGVNEAELFAQLVDKDKRKRSSASIMEAIRERLPKIKGATFEFIDMGKMMMNIGAENSPISINIFGKDIEILKSLSKKIKEKCKGIKGLKDLNITYREGKPELQIIIDRIKASNFGLSAGQIATSIKRALLGEVATRFRSKGEEVDIRVRYDKDFRSTIKAINNISLLSPFGFDVPLYQVAKLKSGSGPIKIFRENQERKVAVTGNIYKRDLGGIIKDIKKRIKNIIIPSGYFLEYGGTYKDMQEAFRSLLFALIVAIILVYMVMAAQFESLLQPFIIMFTIPLAIIGVVFGLFVFKKTLSVPSFMGIIIMGGIVVNNAIVMVDYINQLISKGTPVLIGIIEGASVRLRPILITSLTTILGMLPMAFSRSEGAEMRSPMAIAVTFGLGFSTFLTLFIIPIIYSYFKRIPKKEIKNEKG